MTEEIKIDGLGLAPGVLETIVTIATEQVSGVSGVCAPGIAGMVGKAGSKQIEVVVGESGTIRVSVHVQVEYGTPLPQVADAIKESIADAIKSQVATDVEAVDVFIDGIVFEG